MYCQLVLLVCALQQAYAQPVPDFCLHNQDTYFVCGPDEKYPCVSRSWVCDGTKDCESGADETFCDGCEAGWFLCEIGHPCIAKESVCDGTKDCPDGSDEFVSRCGVCTQDQFHCESGECISNSSVCDGAPHCSDKSDELPPNCFLPTKPPCNPITQFNCLLPSSSLLPHCIPKFFVCDGEEDCDSGIDEGALCGWCADNEFQCYDGTSCLPWSQRCNKIADCDDNSDETDCADVPHCPPKIQFSCTNKNCISWEQYCNGVDECGDDSDEFNCYQIRPTWHECEGMFPCNNSKCIPINRVCDAKDHCGDGSDEPASCGVNECTTDDTCPGTQKCLDSPLYQVCVCPHGFQITKTGCEDINECQHNSRCSQYCTNTEGGFSCSCADGYTLKSDSVTCRANGEDAQLIYASGRDVRIMNLLTHAYRDLAKGRQSVIGVDYDFKEGMVYYADYQRHRIGKVPADNSHAPVTVLSAFNAEGLAFDWINDWIYWSSPHFRTISMAKSDGSYRRVVVNESLKLDEPRGVAVDPLKGYLFWTDWGDHSHIGRAAMDGSDQQHIITNDVVWPNGIAVDTITQHVYWADGKLATVSVADYYGRNKKTLIKLGIGRPLFIALFEDKIYLSSEWGHEKTGRVFVASRMDGSHVTTLENDVQLVQGIAIYQSKQQRSGPNPCDGWLCSDQCVASYASCTGYKCICQDGTQLLNDGLTCENKVTRCSDSYCNNNGQCVLKDGSKSCLCDIHHQGSKCETAISGGCSPSCCHHHGQCHLSITGPYCVCSDGYTGAYCEAGLTGALDDSVKESGNKEAMGHSSQQNSRGNSVGVAVGCAIAGLLAITGVIIIAIFSIRKKQRVESVYSDPSTECLDNHSEENSGFPPP